MYKINTGSTYLSDITSLLNPHITDKEWKPWLKLFVQKTSQNP